MSTHSTIQPFIHSSFTTRIHKAFNQGFNSPPNFG